MTCAQRRIGYSRTDTAVRALQRRLYGVPAPPLLLKAYGWWLPRD